MTAPEVTDRPAGVGTPQVTDQQAVHDMTARLIALKGDRGACRGSRIVNALTVDVEDYFQVSALAPGIEDQTELVDKVRRLIDIADRGGRSKQDAELSRLPRSFEELEGVLPVEKIDRSLGKRMGKNGIVVA